MKIIMLGDFNLPGIDWKDELPVYNFNSNNKFKCIEFINFVLSTGLQQINKICNFKNNILDLILTNLPMSPVAMANNALVPIDIYHPALVGEVRIGFMREIKTNREGLNFSAADFEGLYLAFLKADWSRVYQEVKDVNIAVNEFYSVVDIIISKYVPRFRNKQINDTYPEWYSRDLIKLLNLKNKWHKRYKKTKLLIHYCHFSYLRKLSKDKLLFDYKQFITSIENNLITRPNKFWHYIKKNRNSGVYESTNTYILEDETGTGDEVSELFAKFFSSVHSDLKSSYSNGNILATCFNIDLINEEEIVTTLDRIRPKKSFGIDNIPSYILKACKFIFAPVLKHLFNLSLKTKIFPEKWKTSIVIPILKSGRADNIKNYRPISLIASPAKIFENIIHNRLRFYLSSYLSDNQHAFMKGRSIETLWLQFGDKIIGNMNVRLQTDVIFVDLCKAFDMVNHKTLLAKLDNMGIAVPLLDWLSSYLIKRGCCVRFKGSYSKIYFPSSGIPQGSSLGPLLFLIYINDIIECIKNAQILIFADDIKIFKEINSADDSKLLNNDFINLTQWCEENSMKINYEKSSIMSISNKTNTVLYDYGANSNKLSRIFNKTDLGIRFDYKFSFMEHMVNSVNKACSMLGILKKISSNFQGINTIMVLYNSFVRPIVEFGNLIWDPRQMTYIKLLESVQRKFLNFIIWKFYHNHQIGGYSYKDKLDFFGMSKLELRRSESKLSFIKKCINYKIKSSYILSRMTFKVNNYSSKTKCVFYIQPSDCKKYKISQLTRAMICYNGMINQYEEKNEIRDTIGRKRENKQNNIFDVF